MSLIEEKQMRLIEVEWNEGLVDTNNHHARNDDGNTWDIKANIKKFLELIKNIYVNFANLWDQQNSAD